jgi:hypothetical protein
MLQWCLSENLTAGRTGGGPGGRLSAVTKWTRAHTRAGVADECPSLCGAGPKTFVPVKSASTGRGNGKVGSEKKQPKGEGKSEGWVGG